LQGSTASLPMPDKNGAGSKFSRVPQRQDLNRQYLLSNDPQPFYDWHEAWKNTQDKKRSASPWSRDGSSRTNPGQWGHNVHLLQDGYVNGKRDDLVRASSSTRVGGPRCASPDQRARSPPPKGDGAAPSAAQVPKEWKVHKEHCPDFHMAHISWETKNGSFGKSLRPGTRRDQGAASPNAANAKPQKKEKGVLSVPAYQTPTTPARGRPRSTSPMQKGSTPSFSTRTPMKRPDPPSPKAGRQTARA